MSKPLKRRAPHIRPWRALLVSVFAFACALGALWYFVWRIPTQSSTHPSGVHSLTTYRPLRSGSPYGLVALPDGDAFYFEQGVSTSGKFSEVEAGVATDGKQLREFGIASNDALRSVAIGPTGALWATTILNTPKLSAWHSDIVGLPGSSMAVAFHVPGSLGYSPALAVAPNGAFWLALPDAHAIGYKARLGKLSVIALPGSLKPDVIALDPRGNVYAASSGLRTIVRISATRDIRFLTAPAGVGALAAGPAGDVWFTEPDTNRLARITRSNTIEEVGIGPYVVMQALAVSNDAVWFAVRGGVGRFSIRDRKILIVPFPDRGAQANSIAISRSGVAWIAENIPDGRCVAECGGIAEIVP